MMPLPPMTALEGAVLRTVGRAVDRETTLAPVHDVQAHPGAMPKGWERTRTPDPPQEHPSCLELVPSRAVSRATLGPDDHAPLADGHQSSHAEHRTSVRLQLPSADGVGRSSGL